MDTGFLNSLAEHYNWLLSLYAGLGIIAVSLAGRAVRVIPAFAAAHKLNSETLAKKMERPAYAQNHAWNRKWAGVYLVVIFAGILPFCLTTEAQPWWNVLSDIVIVLMVYDFFYYLMHRFLFHDSKFLGGPLMWVHAVHHRQHNPCRMDSSYIHPIEVAMGLGLFVLTIFLLSFPMGNFHVVTLVVTWVAFSQINLHNHTLWEADQFPFKYLSFLSKMHHNHHARFTGGNFATITLLYDWLFGTIDYGKGWGNGAKRPKVEQEAPTAA